MTIEDVQRLGVIDPVDVQVDDVVWLSLENADDGPKILEILKHTQVELLYLKVTLQPNS